VILSTAASAALLASAIAERQTNCAADLGDLTAQGLLLRAGTLVDATLSAAPPSTKNQAKQRYPEMHQTKKGNQWYFGMKALIGADRDSKRVHTVVVTAANVAGVRRLRHGCTGRSPKAGLLSRRPGSPCRCQFQSDKSVLLCHPYGHEKSQLIKHHPAPIIRHLLACHRKNKPSAEAAARELELSRAGFY
jgi:hypothetical protein